MCTAVRLCSTQVALVAHDSVKQDSQGSQSVSGLSHSHSLSLTSSISRHILWDVSQSLMLTAGVIYFQANISSVLSNHMQHATRRKALAYQYNIWHKIWLTSICFLIWQPKVENSGRKLQGNQTYAWNWQLKVEMSTCAGNVYGWLTEQTDNRAAWHWGRCVGPS